MHDGSGSTNWESFNVDQFCGALLGVMSDVSTGNARAMSYPERIKLFRLEFCIENVKTEDANFIALRQLDNNYGTKADQKECYNLLVKKLTDRFKEQYRSPPLLHGDTLLPFMENSVGDFIRNISQMLITIRKNFRATEAAGGIITYGPLTRCSSVDGAEASRD